MTAGADSLGPSVTPPKSFWEVFVRGGRPFALWVFSLVVVERAMVFPAIQLARGLPVDPVEWVPLTGLAALLVVSRSFDKARGTS